MINSLERLQLIKVQLIKRRKLSPQVNNQDRVVFYTLDTMFEETSSI